MKKKLLLIGSSSSLGKTLDKNLKKFYKIYKTDKHICRDRNYFRIDLSKNIIPVKFQNELKDLDSAIICSFYNASTSAYRNTDKIFFWNINDKILKNSMNLCKLIGIKQIIYLSSAAVYGLNQKKIKIRENKKTKPITVYGKFKLYAEKYIKKLSSINNFNYVIFRLFHIYDDYGNNLIKSILESKKFKKKFTVNGDGTQCRDFLHVDELSLITHKILKKKVINETVNISNGKPYSINSILKKFEVTANYNFSHFKEPYYLVGSNGKIKKLIGYKNKVNFRGKKIKNK